MNSHFVAVFLIVALCGTLLEATTWTNTVVEMDIVEQEIINKFHELVKRIQTKTPDEQEKEFRAWAKMQGGKTETESIEAIEKAKKITQQPTYDEQVPPTVRKFIPCVRIALVKVCV